MENFISSHTASISSCTLRRNVWSGVRNRFFASCWVMVEPPCTTRPARMLATMARTMPMGSKPGCQRKRWSSMAMKAAGT